MLPPSDGYKDFVNRKGWPSYVLQAVVDHQFCFWNICCKMPGSAHDASVLRNSDLFQKAHLLPKLSGSLTPVRLLRSFPGNLIQYPPPRLIQ
ncbi:unnamed protein product [Gadus morhua 'NCC']